MIEAGVGIPGSGKSFYAVHKALQYMAQGGAVFSNIRLHGTEEIPAVEVTGLTLIEVEPSGARFAVQKPKRTLDRYRLADDSNVRRVLLKEFKWIYQEGQFHYIDLDTMDDGFLEAIPRGSASKRILLILDEVNEWFDSLDGGKLKSDAKYREMFKFLRLSRHYHIDVLFLLQDFSTLNARLRGLCACMWKFTDMQKMRVPGVPFRFPFPWFLWQQFDKSGKNALKTITWPKEQCVFDCYDSFCEFGAVGLAQGAFNSDFTGKGRLEKKGGKKMTMWDRVLIACGFVALLAFGGGAARLGVGPSGGLSTVTVTNRVDIVASASAVDSEPVRPRVTVEYAYLSFHQAGEDVWIYGDGKLWRKGQRHEAGLVVDLGKDFIRLVDDGGYEHYIYNREMSPDRPVSDVVMSPPAGPKPRKVSK